MQSLAINLPSSPISSRGFSGEGSKNIRTVPKTLRLLCDCHQWIINRLGTPEQNFLSQLWYNVLGMKSGACLRMKRFLGRQLNYFPLQKKCFIATRNSLLPLNPKNLPVHTLFISVTLAESKTWYHSFCQLLGDMAANRSNLVSNSTTGSLSIIKSWLLLKDSFRLNYKELLELLTVFLDATLHKLEFIKFRTPGAVQRTQWMS